MKEYTIQGADEGSMRLGVLSRTLEKSTTDFLKSVDLTRVKHVVDLGCGTGNVTTIIAEMIGDQGQVLGLDIDEFNTERAIDTAKSQNLENINFKTLDAYQFKGEQQYDMVYARFLLSHLTHPKIVLKNMLKALAHGGKLLIEDTDFSGHFSYPKSTHFDRYVSLYQDVLKKRGANANLGQSLIQLLNDIGFTNIKFHISQPAHQNGEGKLMAEITFQAVSKALIDEQLITKEEFMKVHSELIQFRKREDTIMSLPRIFQIVAQAP